MEGNSQENNNAVVEKNNNSKIIIVVLVILLVGALGFICYDKFINTEKPPVPTPTSVATPNNVEVDNKISKLDKIELTNDNQKITIGNNSFELLSQLEAKELFINNVAITNGDSFPIMADTVYVTDKFAFFTLRGQFDSAIEYAIDLNGNAIKVDAENMYIYNIHLKDGMIVGIGMNALEALDENNNATEEELIVKYENNKITLTSK